MVPSDTRKAFEHLVSDEPVIVRHDYSYIPEQARYDVLAGIPGAAGPGYREQLFFVSKTKCAIFLKEKYQYLG